MKRTLGATLYVVVLVLLGAAWVRSAWLMPLRNYPFDFSINYTGARLLRAEGHDANIYGRTALAEEAAPYTYYPSLYTKLFSHLHPDAAHRRADPARRIDVAGRRPGGTGHDEQHPARRLVAIVIFRAGAEPRAGAGGIRDLRHLRGDVRLTPLGQRTR
jgi:hypothetical protein